MTFYLERHPAKGKKIPGALYLNLRGEDYICGETIENTDFIIPDGTYRLGLTYSPKFKKVLPLLFNVPARSGIRIHFGSKPEHSKGCILVSKDLESKIIKVLQKYKEETKIVISTLIIKQR